MSINMRFKAKNGLDNNANTITNVADPVNNQDVVTKKYAVDNYQPLDGDLTAIAAITATVGLLKKTSSNNWVLDTNSYLTAETDTLASVTARGATTSEAITINNDLTIGGNLIVNGSTITANSTTVTIDDPVFTLGGDTAAINDSKDRGIEFKYYDNGSKIGFFGYKKSTNNFTYLLDVTNTSEVFTGTKGVIDAYIDWSNLNNNPATTVGTNILSLSNPGAVSFIRLNADNSVTALSASDFRSAIGAGTSSTTGTVTSVAGTGTVSGLTLTGTVTTTGSLTLSGSLSVEPTNFASQPANRVLAAPDGNDGTPSFRSLVSGDIPSLNANKITSGTLSTSILGTGTANSTTYLRGDNTWQTISTNVSITDDTTTNSTLYPTFVSATSGTTSGVDVSSTKLQFNPSTGILSATNFSSLSDERLKTNVESIYDGLSIIRQLNPVEFDWKDTGDKGYGVIAQQLEQILPALVKSSGENKTVIYDYLIAFLISAVKQLAEQIESK